METSRLLRQYRLASLLAAYEAELASHPEPKEHLRLCYELGCMHWGGSGDGEEARRWFQEAVAVYQEAPESFPKDSTTLAANACENLMHLSLSFDEYERWASELESIRPDYEILAQQRPVIREVRNRGAAWREAMIALASAFTVDSLEHVASAACIARLLLVNRRQLRVPREIWRETISAYSRLVTRLVSLSFDRMNRNAGRVDYKEFQFIPEKALPLIQDFTDENPTDTEITNLRNELLRAMDQSSHEVSDRGATTEDRQSRPPTRLGAAGPVVFWSVVAFLCYVAFDSSWRLVGVAVAGLFALLSLLHCLSRIRAGGGTSAARSFDGIDEDERTRYWCRSPELEREAKRLGLSGMRFQLRSAGIKMDGSLELSFASMSAIPESREADAELALRCVVAITFPEVATITPGRQVMLQENADYCVRLGNGVPMRFYWVRADSDTVGPIQARSSHDGDEYVVRMSPFTIAAADADRLPQKWAAVLAPVASMFQRLENEPLVL